MSLIPRPSKVIFVCPVSQNFIKFITKFSKNFLLLSVIWHNTTGLTSFLSLFSHVTLDFLDPYIVYGSFINNLLVICLCAYSTTENPIKNRLCDVRPRFLSRDMTRSYLHNLCSYILISFICNLTWNFQLVQKVFIRVSSDYTWFPSCISVPDSPSLTLH